MNKILLIVFALFLCTASIHAVSGQNMGNNTIGVSNSGALFDGDGVTVEEAYPNPAESFVELKYRITNPEASVKVLFHNVLGVRMGEFTLKEGQNRLTVSTEKFIPGVYFYTLNVNNQNVITKKLIVKR